MSELYIYPTSDNSVAMQYVYPTSPTTHWDKVDDAWDSPDEDSTYIWADTNGDYKDLYNLSNHTTETGSITNVRVVARVYRETGDGDYIVLHVYTDGSQYDSPAQTVTTSYADVYYDWATNPAGGDWDWTDIDNLVAGATFTRSQNRDIFCTQLYVRVTYASAETYYEYPTDLEAVSDSLKKEVGKYLDDSVNLDDNIEKEVGKKLNDNILLNDIFKKDIGKSLNDVVTLNDVLSRIVNYNRAFQENVEIVDELEKEFDKILSDLVSLNDNLQTQIFKLKSLYDDVTVSDVLSRVVSYHINPQENILLSETFKKDIDKSLNDGIILNEEINKNIGKILNDSILLNDVLYKNVGKTLSDMILLDDTLIKEIDKKIIDNIELDDSLNKNINKTLAENVILGDALVKEMYKELTDTILISEDLDLNLISAGTTLYLYPADIITLNDDIDLLLCRLQELQDIVFISDTISLSLISGEAAYYSLDPRETIREYLGTERYISNDKIYTITIADEHRINHNIPIYLTEETKAGLSPLPALPFIELGLLLETMEEHNVGATVRKHEVMIDVNIYWQKMDNIDSINFGKEISEELNYLIRGNKCRILGTDYSIYFLKTGRVFIEKYGKQVVYHKNMELYVQWYDNIE